MRMFLQVVWWSQQVSYCHWALTKQHHEELEPREQPVQGKHCGCTTSTMKQGAWFHLELDIAGREDLDLCTY